MLLSSAVWRLGRISSFGQCLVRARGWRNSGLCCGSKGRRAPRNREAHRWRGAPWLSPKWGPGSKAMGPPGRMNMHHYELPAICCENQSTLLKPTLKQKARQLKALSCSVFLAGNCWGPAEQSKLRLWEWGWQQSSEMVPVLGAVEWEESRCSRTQLNDWALTKWTPSSWDSQLQLLVKVRILWCQLVEAPDDEKAGTCARPKSFQIIRASVWSFGSSVWEDLQQFFAFARAGAVWRKSSDLSCRRAGCQGHHSGWLRGHQALWSWETWRNGSWISGGRDSGSVMATVAALHELFWVLLA